MRLSLMATVVVLSVFSTSYAKEIYSDGDWVLDDSDPKKAQSLCKMFVATDAGSNQYQLELIKAKGSRSNLDIQIIQQGTKNIITSWHAELRNGSILSFAHLGPLGAKQNLIWYIPQKTDELIGQLLDRRDVKMKPADLSKDPRLTFSSDGFKNVYRKFAEKCLGNKDASLIESEFDDMFIQNKDSLNPSRLTVEQAKELKRIHGEGYKTYLNIGANKSDLVNLRNRFLNQLNESAELDRTIRTLGSQLIPDKQEEIRANDEAERGYDARLAVTNQTISVRTSAVNSAEKVLSAAKAQVAPLQSEHDSRELSASRARSTSNSLASRLGEIDNNIAQSGARLNALRGEEARLRNQLATMDMQLNGTPGRRDGALDEAERANRDYQTFRPRMEIEERLRRDRGYDLARRELPALERAYQVAQSATNDARGKLKVRETELRVCQGSGVSLIGTPSFRLPAQSRPGGDDGQAPRGGRYNPPGQGGGDGQGPRGPRPTQPTGPAEPAPTTPTPAPVPTPAAAEPTPAPTQTSADCSAQQNAVNQAKTVVMTLESQERSAQQSLQQAQGRVEGIERRVEQEVEGMRNELARRATIASQRANALQGQMAEASRRLDMVVRSEIPREENNLGALNNERPGVQASYNQAEPEARRLEAELANFEARTNWDAKVRAVSVAESDLAAKNRDLRESLNEKGSLEARIANCRSLRPRLNNDLISLNNTKVNKENRLVEVKKSLEPYDSEKARLEGVGSDLRNTLSAQATQFEGQLPR